MPAKKASKDKVVNPSARVSAKKKATQKMAKKPVVKANDLSAQISAFFNKVRSSASTEAKSKTGGPLGKRFFLPLIGLLVLLGLAYLASKFLVVAWVDNKPLTRFVYYQQLDKKYGKDLREQMIVEALINSEAQKKGMTASDQEVNQEIKKIENEQGGADKLNQILQLQGISQDELRRLVKLQLLRQKLFGQGLAISDAELNNYFEQNKQNILGTQTDASSEAKAKDNLRQQLLQQKINATFSAWLQSNLNSNRVVRVQ